MTVSELREALMKYPGFYVVHVKMLSDEGDFYETDPIIDACVEDGGQCCVVLGPLTTLMPAEDCKCS